MGPTAAGGMNMQPAAPVPTVTPGAPADIPAAKPNLSAFPVTIQNCGRTLTFSKPPERAVALYPLTAEILLRLGLKDRIVATGLNAGDPPAPDLTAAFQKLPALSTDQPPSKEVLLTAQPDFVIDNFPGFFYNEAQGLASIEQLKANGAQAYTLTARCDGNEANGKYADIYTDITNIGKIFGISAEADTLVAAMQQRAAAVQKAIDGKPKARFMIYDSGVGPINVYGPGAISNVAEQAGGENVFADQPREFAMLSAEVVASRDPEVFIITEHQGQRGMSMGKDLNAQEAADFLIKTFPNTSAAKNKRVVVVPYQQLYASIQNIDGIEALAKAFYPDAAMRSPAAGSYPVTIQNCGRTLTFDKAPQRVIGLWQPSNELLLGLGLQDNIVAMAGNYTDLRPDLAAAATKITIIGTSMQWPSKEVLLNEKPDLVISEGIEGFMYDTSQGYPSVAEIEATGAKVLSTGGSCTPADPKTQSKTTQQVYDDLLMLGKVFGVSDRAEALVKQLQDREAAVLAKVAGKPPVKVAFYNGGEGPVYVLTFGIWGDLMRKAGGQDVIKATGYQVTNEEFAASQPDVILVGTYPGQEAATSIAFLKKTFPNVPAVQNDRLVTIPTIDTEASVRVVDGLEEIAKGIHPEAFK